MKYGIYFAYWAREWDVDYLPFIPLVKKLGFDILEISCAALKNSSKERLSELSRAAKDAGVELTAGYGPGPQENLGSSDPAVIRNAVAFYRDILDKLSCMGITTIGGGIYSYWPVDYSKPIEKQRDWDESVKNVRTVGKIAGDYGINYCLEVLNRFEGYLLNTCREALEFVEQVDVPAVKIMLDTFHMNIEEDNMLDAIRLAGDRLGHFHVGENNRRLPGQGTMPWRQIGEALHQIHYDKAVVMEPFVMPGGQVGRDIKVWRSMCADTSQESLDRQAQQSVQYLREIFRS